MAKIEDYGRTSAGHQVRLFTLENKNGVKIQLTEFGATLVRFIVPDKNGVPGDIVLGYDDIEGYENDQAYFGATVGRYANRIANGKFEIDGNVYQLDINNGPNHIHGGLDGFNKRLWKAEDVSCDAEDAVRFTLVSPDNDQNYPGTLTVQVTYTLKNNGLQITYRAESDKATIVNLTDHSYFNLSANMTNPITDHEVTLNAKYITPVNENLIPTGQVLPVDKTPLDFNRPKVISTGIDEVHEQVQRAGGFDHNWVIDGDPGTLRFAAAAFDKNSGRYLEMYTDQPGVQFYTGNFLDGTVSGKDQVKYSYRSGFCFEAQNYPDAPNHPAFPSPRLEPGNVYTQRTEYRIGTK